jgi:hypothetical protein
METTFDYLRQCGPALAERISGWKWTADSGGPHHPHGKGGFNDCRIDGLFRDGRVVQSPASSPFAGTLRQAVAHPV